MQSQYLEEILNKQLLAPSATVGLNSDLFAPSLDTSSPAALGPHPQQQHCDIFSFVPPQHQQHMPGEARLNGTLVPDLHSLVHSTSSGKDDSAFVSNCGGVDDNSKDGSVALPLVQPQQQRVGTHPSILPSSPASIVPNAQQQPMVMLQGAQQPMFVGQPTVVVLSPSEMMAAGMNMPPSNNNSNGTTLVDRRSSNAPSGAINQQGSSPLMMQSNVVPKHDLSAEDEEAVKSNLFVCTLPVSANDNDLYELFKPFGPIESAKVMLNIHTGLSRGIAFVKFASSADAAAAIEGLDGSIFQGQQIAVRIANAKAIYQPGAATNKTFVRNVPSSISKDRLSEYFSKFGEVLDICVLPDSASSMANNTVGGQHHFSQPTHSKNIVFVTFAGKDSAKNAATEIHTTTPFPECEGIPLLAKVAEDASRRSERLSRRQQQQQQQQLSHAQHNDLLMSPQAMSVPSRHINQFPVASVPSYQNVMPSFQQQQMAPQVQIQLPSYAPAVAQQQYAHIVPHQQQHVMMTVPQGSNGGFTMAAWAPPPQQQQQQQPIQPQPYLFPAQDFNSIPQYVSLPTTTPAPQSMMYPSSSMQFNSQTNHLPFAQGSTSIFPLASGAPQYLGFQQQQQPFPAYR